MLTGPGLDLRRTGNGKEDVGCLVLALDVVVASSREVRVFEVLLEKDLRPRPSRQSQGEGRHKHYPRTPSDSPYTGMPFS